METTEPTKGLDKATDVAILEAFSAIRREDFVPFDIRQLASLNEALPIGYGQTISQPLVVEFMLELLGPERGDRILDIGAGSGWTTALLAHIVSKQGRIIAAEVIPELKQFGEKNVAKYSFIKKGVVKYLLQDGSKGYPLEAPYDGILVSAALDAKRLPRAWQTQLRIGGKIVVPVQNSIWVFTKKSEAEFKEKEYPGFIFVPFIT